MSRRPLWPAWAERQRARTAKRYRRSLPRAVRVEIVAVSASTPAWPAGVVLACVCGELRWTLAFDEAGVLLGEAREMVSAARRLVPTIPDGDA